MILHFYLTNTSFLFEASTITVTVTITIVVTDLFYSLYTQIEKQTTAYTSQVGIKQVKTDVPEMAKDVILKVILSIYIQLFIVLDIIALHNLL